MLLSPALLLLPFTLGITCISLSATAAETLQKKKKKNHKFARMNRLQPDGK